MAFSDEQNKYLKRLYTKANQSRRKAKELFEVKYRESISLDTIRRKWVKDGLKMNSHGGYRHGLTDEEFKEIYWGCKEDMQKMKEKTGRLEKNLVYRCSQLGLKPKNLSKNKSKNFWEKL